MSKKFGLGKGLGALIPDEELIEETNNEKTFIDLNKIKTNDEQPRKYFDNDKIRELSESISNHGIIQPLILRKSGEFYTIIAGERRWRAAKLIGLKSVPAVIMELSEKDILEVSLIENIQREDLNPIEEAIAYKKLIEEFSLKQDELSKRIGKSRTSITNTLRLLNLDDRVQSYLIEGIISEGHGRTLLAIEDKEVQYEIAQRIIDDKISVRELEKLIKSLGNRKETNKTKSNLELNPYYKDIRDRLQNYFGTKVSINQKEDKGKIEIEYYSEEDLQRILDIIKL